MFAVKSDPFCNHYNDLYKITKHDHANANPAILSTIQANIREINQAQSLNDLSFDHQGSIHKPTKFDKSVSIETKNHDLIEFTRFAKWYLGNVHLHENESKQIRKDLDIALTHLKDIDGLTIFTSNLSETNLSKAAENSLLNEMLELTKKTEDFPGKDVINDRIAKLQPQAIKAKEDEKLANRSLSIGIGGGIVAAISPIFIALTPVFIALLAIGGATFLIGYPLSLFFSTRAGEEHKNAVAELKQLDQLRKHYDEPEFQEFQKLLNALNPDEKAVFLTDFEKVKDFHQLYEKVQENKLAVQQNDAKKMDALKKEIESLEKKLFKADQVPLVKLDAIEETTYSQVPLDDIKKELTPRQVPLENIKEASYPKVPLDDIKDTPSPQVPLDEEK